jgi:hypothetical protein
MPAVDEDAELEKRLANLRKAKGATPYKEGVKKEKRSRRAGEDDDVKPQASGEQRGPAHSCRPGAYAQAGLYQCDG